MMEQGINVSDALIFGGKVLSHITIYFTSSTIMWPVGGFKGRMLLVVRSLSLMTRV